jgi:hypothetical protein
MTVSCQAWFKPARATATALANGPRKNATLRCPDAK